MILTNITLNNFGTYAGSQSVSLAPRPGKNIVLFGGKNGAGKSTLLEAVRLCFYGHYAAKELQVAESYDKYLLSRIHTDPNAVIQASNASVEVNFDYSENGCVETYSVLRSWERRNGSGRVTEAFILKRNGEIVRDLDSEHWQDFIRDLVPSGISQLFFFDGEKIQHLAEDETDQLSLGESIKALLGLDIIERLQADLSIFKSRNLKTLEVEGSEKLEELVQLIEQLRSRLAGVCSERDSVSNNIKNLQANIHEAEQAVTVRGGGFSKNRERLQKRRTELKTRVEIHEQTIREIAGQLLPFLIAMPLCKDLVVQLEREEELEANRALKNKLAKIRADFSVLISRPKLWKSLGVTAPVRGSNVVLSELDEVLRSALREPKTRQVHRVSASEREQMVAWIEDAGQLRPVLQRVSSELEQFYRELQKCERELGRVPSDEILKPYLDQLNDLNTRLGRSMAEFAMHEERSRVISSELEEIQRKLDRQTDEVASRAKGALNLRRASTIHVVLDEYRTVLMRKKVEQLESAISECFNVLSRKKDTLRTLKIDPANFSVQLMDRNQRPLKKSELSAGEKQIFAVAVLWGLAKVSGKPLPMIVDTPLARLDSDHRRLLAENYFPRASHQVIVLSTDTEIDRKYFDLMHEHVSHSYTLEYSSQVNGTVVKEGYFGNEVN